MNNQILSLTVSNQQIVDKIDLKGLIPSVNHDQRAEPIKIVNWLRQLLDVTQKKDQDITVSFVANLSLMLYAKFPRWAFSSNTLLFVAEHSKFFPTFSELCKLLPEAIQLIRQRQSEQRGNVEYKNERRYVDLSSEGKAWVGIYHNHVANKWRNEGEEREPSFDIQDDRENEYVSMTKKHCIEAYAFLFPREYKAEQEEYVNAENIRRVDWSNEANTLNTLEQIKTIPSVRTKKQLFSTLKTAVKQHSPENLALIEEWEQQKKQGVAT